MRVLFEKAVGPIPGDSVAGPVTINRIAQELFIDQSGVSRLVQEATAAGFLQVTPSAHDGRQKAVALTASGVTMLEDAARWQAQIFEQLTEDWTAKERQAFARGLERLIDRSRTAHP